MDQSFDILGISEAEVDQLMIDILDYTEKLKGIFVHLEDLLSDTNLYYQSESATLLRNKFQLLKDNFPVSIENMLSYQADLATLKSQYIKKTSDLSDIIIQNPDEIKLERKS